MIFNSFLIFLFSIAIIIIILFVNQGSAREWQAVSVGHLTSILVTLAIMLILSLIYFALVARRLNSVFTLLDNHMHSMGDDLNRIAEITRDIAGGELSSSFSIQTKKLIIHSSDELGTMASTFNVMQERLKETGEYIARITTNLSRQNAELNKSNRALEEMNAFIVREMQQYRKMENALQESEKKFRTISISAVDAIIMIDNEGAVSYWNPAAEKIFGYSEKEMMGVNVHSILAPEKYLRDHRRAFSRWQLSGEGGAVGRVMELSAVRKDGKEIPVELSLSSVQIGASWNAIAIARDMSERVAALEALDASEEKLKFIYEGSDALMFLTEKRFFDCNRRALDMFGIGDKKEFLRLHPGDISPPVQPDGRDSHKAADEMIQDAFRQGYNRFEWIHRRKNGEDFPAEVLLSAFNYRGTKVLQATVHDITAHKEMAVALQRAKEEAERANRIKSEFIANISHEIRTPINAIIGFSELLGERTTDEKSREYVKGILAGGKNLLSLIEDILDLSKIEAGRMTIHLEAVNPHSYCEDMAHIFAVQASDKGIALNVIVSPSLPAGLMLDGVRIRQILMNLLGNAVKFTEKGSVTLRIMDENVQNEKNTLDLIIEVEDTGIGISEDQRDVIFEAFLQHEGQSTRRFGGTGLGLTITRRLVRMMGGTINLQSELGKGSRFRVHLPDVRIARVEQAPAEELPEFENIRFNGASVLLAEDMESNRQVIAGLLEPHDVKLIMASNGQEALEKVSANVPDIILMDLQMPVMDGYEAVKALRGDERFRSIPIVAITASAMEHDRHSIKDLLDGYLRKPLTKNRLLREMARFLPYSRTECKDVETPDETESALPAETSISPEVMQYLLEDVSIRWKEVRSTMVVEDIKTFADDLREMGALHGIRSLREYGDTLYQQASLFKIDRMIQTLEHFSNLLNTDAR